VPRMRPWLCWTGSGACAGFWPDDPAEAHFLYSLRAKRALLVTTSLVIVDGEPDDTAGYPGLTVCDVIVALRRQGTDSRHGRLLEVLKAAARHRWRARTRVPSIALGSQFFPALSPCRRD
jgi:hypothetical protein